MHVGGGAGHDHFAVPMVRRYGGVFLLWIPLLCKVVAATDLSPLNFFSNNEV